MKNAIAIAIVAVALLSLVVLFGCAQKASQPAAPATGAQQNASGQLSSEDLATLDEFSQGGTDGKLDELPIANSLFG